MAHRPVFNMPPASQSERGNILIVRVDGASSSSRSSRVRRENNSGHTSGAGKNVVTLVLREHNERYPAPVFKALIAIEKCGQSIAIFRTPPKS